MRDEARRRPRDLDGFSVETSRGDAAATTWILRGYCADVRNGHRALRAGESAYWTARARFQKLPKRSSAALVDPNTMMKAALLLAASVQAAIELAPPLPNGWSVSGRAPRTEMIELQFMVKQGGIEELLQTFCGSAKPRRSTLASTTGRRRAEARQTRGCGRSSEARRRRGHGRSSEARQTRGCGRSSAARRRRG